MIETKMCNKNVFILFVIFLLISSKVIQKKYIDKKLQFIDSVLLSHSNQKCFNFISTNKIVEMYHYKKKKLMKIMTQGFMVLFKKNVC